MNWMYDPWPWYVAGPLIAFIMLMLLLAGKQFGMSSSLSTTCAALGAGRVANFFKFDWKEGRWNLLIVFGAVIGGFIASTYMSDNTVQLSPDIVSQLSEDYNIQNAGATYLPNEIFGSDHLTKPFNITILLIAGLLVGFGARYAGGCTSGHAISGLSNLQLPSLIAVIGFFIGGLTMIHLIYPQIF